jgi:hypothetical protein
MPGKERDVPAEKIFDKLSERLSSIDFRPPKPPSLTPPPVLSGEVEAILAKIKAVDESLDAAGAERRQTFASFTALLQARLAALPPVETPEKRVVAPASKAAPPPLPEIPKTLLSSTTPASAPPAPEPREETPPSQAQPLSAPAPERGPSPRGWLASLWERAKGPAPAASPEPVETVAEPVEPAPEPMEAATAPLGRRPYGLAAAAASLVAVVGAIAYFARPAPAHSVFPFAVLRTAGLALVDHRLLTLDTQRQLLFFIDTASAEIAAIHKIPSADFTGVASGSGFLWVTTRGGKLAQVGLDADHAASKTYELPLARPGALHWDGGSLWLSDAAAGTIRRFSVGQVLATTGIYRLPGISPVALFASSGMLWILDGPSGRLLRYRVGDSLKQVDGADLKAWLGEGATATGLAVDADSLWISAENPTALHRLSRGRLAFTPLEPFAR